MHVHSDSHSIKYQARFIISRSPNLRYFIGSDTSRYIVESDILIPPKFVLAACPKFECYAGDGTFDHEEEHINEALTKSLGLSWASTTADNNYSSKNKDRRRGQQE